MLILQKKSTVSISSDIEKLFGEALSQYKVDVEASLSLFKSLKFPLIDFQQQISSIQTLVAGLTPALVMKPNDAVLSQIFSIDFQVYSLLNSTGVQIASAINSAVETISKQPLTNAGVITQLTASTNALLAEIKNSATDPYPLFKKFANDLGELHTSFESAFTKQTILPNEALANQAQNNIDRQELQTAINKGDYVAAANTVEKFLARNKPKGVVQNLNPSFRVQDFNAAVPATMGGTTTVTSQLIMTSSNLDNFEIATKRSLRFAQFWQTLLSGIVILVIGYALYADEFVGNPTQIASIFVWAFTLDISVTTIMSGLAAKVIKK